MKKTLVTLGLCCLLTMAGCTTTSPPPANDTALPESPLAIRYEERHHPAGPIYATADVFAMDTLMTLSVYVADKAQGEAALTAGALELQRLDALLSTSRPGSEVYELNAAGRGTLGPEGRYLLARALSYHQATEGLFDVAIYPVVRAWGFTGAQFQVPTQERLDQLLPLTDPSVIDFSPETGAVILPLSGMALDFGAIAKGYAGNRLMDIFHDHGIASGLVSLGGNVQVLGTKPDGSDFRVAIQNPFAPEENILIISVHDKAVITSGAYQRFFEQDGVRYHHIIDPRTGSPAQSGLASVSIISADGTAADALSTSLFIMGLAEGSAYWQSHSEAFEAVFVTDDGQVHLTAGLAKRNPTAPTGTPVVTIPYLEASNE